MAITQADGSIILKTKVDTTGINAGMKSIKGFASTIGKTFLAVSAAATAAIVTITKQAVSAYAEYEQMVGSITTLWGKSSQKIIDYADQAFYSAGVSATAYMQQVTQFSAALIRSTAGDTDKAADIANMALIDMSDNAAKMGTQMEYIQLAYQGIARQQYLLLDNLRLGYGGTKTEMERLLRDAQAITGIKYNINNLADVYSAIHVIQEELGIAGATAKEAATTIQGSSKMMKAAWQDVLRTIAGGGDIDKAIENFSKSVTIYFKNIAPVIKTALSNVGKVIAEILPDIVKMLAQAIVEAIPMLIAAIWDVLVGLLEGIAEGIASWFTGDLSNQMQDVIDNTKEATKEQKKLTDQIEETTAAQKRALAGFDEINTLYSTEMANFGGSGNGSQNNSNNSFGVDDEIWGSYEEVINSATSEWKEFWHEVKGDLDISAFLNLENAGLKLKNSVVNFGNTMVEQSKRILSAIFGEVDGSKLVADIINFQTETTAGMTESLSGFMDILTALNSGDGELAWGGFGKVYGGQMQSMIPLIELITGEEQTALREFFFPIYEDIPNLFKEMTATQAEALKIFKETYNAATEEMRQITYGVIITDAEVEDSKKQIKKISDSIISYIEVSRKKAKSDLGQLVEDGLMSEEDFEKAVKQLDKAYDNTKTVVAENEKAINKIIQKASDEQRALTAAERAEVNNLLEATNREMTETVASGAGDRADIQKKLDQYEGTLAKTHLSEIIKLANEQYKGTVAAAEAEYEETVETANRLYYEHGVISEEDRDKIIADAEQRKKNTIRIAKEEKDGVIENAQAAAGENAKYVDPETGEIISEWDAMWKEMYNDVKSWMSKLGSLFSGSLFGFFGGSNWNTGFLKKLIDLQSRVPGLANGSVIPGGRSFLAVLGDQPAGQTNIEAPLDTIKQAVAEVISQTGSSASSHIEVPVIIDGREVARAVRNAESTMGGQTVYGGFSNVY